MFDAFHRVADAVDDLVAPGENDHMTWAERDTADTIADHIQIHQHTIFGNRVGSAEKQIGQQCLPATFDDIGTRNSGFERVDHMDTRVAYHRLEDACGIERQRVSPRNTSECDTGQDIAGYQVARVVGIICAKSFKTVLHQCLRTALQSFKPVFFQIATQANCAFFLHRDSLVRSRHTRPSADSGRDLPLLLIFT